MEANFFKKKHSEGENLGKLDFIFVSFGQAY